MRLALTAVFREVPEGVLGWVEELPGAIVQEATLGGARASLREAITLVMEANREFSRSSIGDAEVIREPLDLEAV